MRWMLVLAVLYVLCSVPDAMVNFAAAGCVNGRVAACEFIAR